MLRGFFDDSREAGSVYILAGFVASVEQWIGFSDRWEQALTMASPRWNAFKMKRVNINDPAQLERAEYHYRIVEEFLPAAFCVAIPIPALTKVMEEYRIEPKFRNPYYLVWLATISLFRNNYLYSGWTQPIDLIFDNQSESKMVLQAWDVLVEQNDDIKPFQNAPMFRSDEEMLPLQAADLLAWWARKNWVEHGTFDNQKWLFPWEERTPGPDYFFAEMDEDGIRKHLLNTMIAPDSSGLAK
jgi:hypothetical protein